MSKELPQEWKRILDRLPQVIETSHGTGGKMTHELIETLFVPLFRNPTLATLQDQAVVDTPAAGRLALSTDSFVVQPFRFPGGNIGDLAVHGTVNDLLMGGATPLYLTVAFVLMEGMALKDLVEVTQSMANAAKKAKVQIVTGDTKVVEGRSEDGLFLTTTGLGVVPPWVDWRPECILPGDAVILSGTVGDHGASVMASRYEMEFETQIQSDTACLREVVMAVRDLQGIHCMRDPTRGGLATTLAELSAASGLCLKVRERDIPIREDVRGLCEVLGLDPLYVANEGKLVAVVAPEVADEVVRRMRQTAVGREARVIGEVDATLLGEACLVTELGAQRVLDLLAVEQLPRIC